MKSSWMTALKISDQHAAYFLVLVLLPGSLCCCLCEHRKSQEKESNSRGIGQIREVEEEGDVEGGGRREYEGVNSD